MPVISFPASPLTLLSAKMVSPSVVSALFDYTINAGVGNFALSNGTETRTVVSVGGGTLPDEVYLYLNLPMTAGLWTLTVTGVQAGSPPVTISPNPSTAIFFANVLGSPIQDVPPPFSAANQDAAKFLRAQIPSSMSGSVWDAYIAALATAEQPAWDNAPAVEKNLFLATAVDGYLDRRAAAVGVERPPDVGLPDSPFRDLVIEMTAGQVTTNSFLDVLTAFYGVAGTHAHIASGPSPYLLVDGQVLTMTFDGRDVVPVTLRVADYTNIAAATATEVAGALNRAFLMAGLDHLAAVETDPTTSLQTIVLYSGTLGARSTVQVSASAAQAALGFGTSLTRLLGQPRASYVVPHGFGDVEVVFPATTDVVVRDPTTAAYITDYGVLTFYGTGLYGTGPYGPSGTRPALKPRGPYLFETPANGGLSLTQNQSTTAQVLLASHSYRLIAVANSSEFPDVQGWVVFAYGYDWQVGPVPYLGTSGALGLILDPSFEFTATVPSGAVVRLLASDKPRQSRFRDPGDFWLTNSPAGRVAAENTIDEVSAGGLSVTHTISYPGDVGLGNAGHPTHGVPDISDIVACFSGNDIDVEVAIARST